MFNRNCNQTKLNNTDKNLTLLKGLKTSVPKPEPIAAMPEAKASRLSKYRDNVTIAGIAIIPNPKPK